MTSASPRRTTALACLVPLGLALLAGCAAPADTAEDQPTYAELGFDGRDPTGSVDEAWPDFAGVTLTILDHGAFAAFGDAAARFENLTGARVEHVEANDAGSMLNLALLEKGSPSADVVYGLDNVLLSRAEDRGILHPYTPVFADLVDPQYVFFGAERSPWPATPVDHGYIAINADLQHEALGGANLTDLDDVRENARHLVVQDPNTSSVGLGFLLATIATYTEGDGTAATGWRAYWVDLFESGVLVTAGWSEAYEQHFSGGYGPSIGGRGDKPLVVSYTESPAYEAFFGRAPEELAVPLVAPNSTFQQVQTMAILSGTDDLAAAQAWIEFSLTDAFQELAAPGNAVYPVVREGVDANATYGEHDPEPGTFRPARFGYLELGAGLEGWLQDWTGLCEEHGCR